MITFEGSKGSSLCISYECFSPTLLTSLLNKIKEGVESCLMSSRFETANKLTMLLIEICERRDVTIHHTLNVDEINRFLDDHKSSIFKAMFG